MLGKNIACLLFFLLVFCFVGCSLPGAEDMKAPTSSQTSEVANIINVFQTKFRSAVMKFDRDAMLADFENTEFDTIKILTITEGDCKPYEKDYQTLYDELGCVVADQVKWQLKYNYQLTLNLSELTYHIDSGSHGLGEQRFAVLESGDGYPNPLTTDTGQITWEVQNIAGVWKIEKMTILYDPSPRIANLAPKGRTRSGAFGFGKCLWE